MIRESVAFLIDAIDDFLEEKGVEIENDEKEDDEDAAIIYGSDFDDVEERLRETLKSSGIYIADTYNETVPEPEDGALVIFVPSQGEFVKIEEGTGDNLLKEDRADGYVDYLNYDRYSPADLGVSEENIDGGMLMLREYVSSKYKSLIEAVPDILGEAYSERDLSFIVLYGGKKF